MNPARRSFLTSSATLAMGAGLLLGYGSCFAVGMRYLYPAAPRTKRWQFVSEVARIEDGGQVKLKIPGGGGVVIARQGTDGTVDDFIALSDTCPHLGCKVHWQPTQRQFFCPCHNGAFDAQGKGISGPPGDAGQVLASFPLRVEDGLLFIEVPEKGLEV